MKYIPLSILLLATVSSCDGCKNKSTSTTDEIYVSDSIKEYSPESQIIQYSQDPENTDTPIDTTSIEFENIPTASVADSINLYIAGLAQNEKAIHVSFSDVYQNDTLDVPPHYIKNQKKLGKEFMKYFPLTGNYRTRFFKRMKFSETDTLYLYNIDKNRLKKFPLSTLRVAANLNVYADEKNISSYNYEIGFEVYYTKDKLSMKEAENGFAFAYVGKENPFVENQMQVVTWKEIKTSAFPATYKIVNPKYKLGKAYKYHYKQTTCYIQDFTEDDSYYDPIARYFVVIDNNTKKIIKRQFFKSGESTSITPAEKNDIIPPTYIGHLLKGKPACIFGLYGESFGCEALVCLSDNYSDLPIQCDNRH